MKSWIQNQLNPSTIVQKNWNLLSRFPGGKSLFSLIVGRFIPYTGSISPLVQKIENGQAVVLMKDKSAVRNHLHSVHAIALANLGEFSTGLSLMSKIPPQAKAILVRLETQYLIKARGPLTATAVCDKSNWDSESEVTIVSDICNQQGQTVCQVHATWRVRL